jgi:predicted dehydrogenase
VSIVREQHAIAQVDLDNVMKGEAFNPKRIAVLGGGRWARVIISELRPMVGQDTRISIYSPTNAPAMRRWTTERHLENVDVLDVQPDFRSRDAPEIAIVANAADDHKATATRAINAGVATLVEKPMALTEVDACEIVTLAERNNALLASSRVLLFARYITEFSRLVTGLGGIGGIHVSWADPAGEPRYGEAKRFDPALTLPQDVLPHLLPILNLLTTGAHRLTEVIVDDGGARVEIRMQAGNVPCVLSFGRNAPARRRFIEVQAAEDSATLDFSWEPGQVTVGGKNCNGDPLWDVEPRPLASMLQCFLTGVAKGKIDERLSPKRVIAECRFSDQVLAIYLQKQGEWLAAQQGRPIDNGILYALAEILARHDRTRLLGEEVILPIWTSMNAGDRTIFEALARGDRNAWIRMSLDGIV